MPQILYAVVNSGAAVSGDVDLSQGQLGLVQLPVVTSGDLYVRGSFDTTSALFTRVHNESGVLAFPTGPGSAMTAWPLGILSPPYVRFEFSVTQTSPRTLVVLRF